MKKLLHNTELELKSIQTNEIQYEDSNGWGLIEFEYIITLTALNYTQNSVKSKTVDRTYQFEYNCKQPISVHLNEYPFEYECSSTDPMNSVSINTPKE